LHLPKRFQLPNLNSEICVICYSLPRITSYYFCLCFLVTVLPRFMFFPLSYDSLLPPPTHNTSMASRSPRLLSLARRAFSSSSSQANGVSLVQGASRGIGLEFVRIFLPQKQCLAFLTWSLFFMDVTFFSVF